MSNKYIAGNLAITEATVKAHITAILRKLAPSAGHKAIVPSVCCILARARPSMTSTTRLARPERVLGSMLFITAHCRGSRVTHIWHPSAVAAVCASCV